MDTEKLSRREDQVLHLLAWGHTNREIAERLGVSVKTIEAHRANGMRKRQLASRAALVRDAVESGWLTRDSLPASDARPSFFSK